jgi:hypothetical protein
LLSNNPDVTSVDVKLSPFFVSNVPKSDKKVKVVVAKPTLQKSNNAGN